MGFAEYLDKQFPFICENGILKLIPPSVEEWKNQKNKLLFEMAEYRKLKDSQEWIGYSYIKGKSLSF